MSQKKLVVFVACCLIAVTAVAGCGKKARPKPPIDIAPAMVEVFTAEGSVEGVRLFWNPPTSTVNGGELVNLAGFIVWRSLAIEGERPDFEQLAEVPWAPVETEGQAPQRYQYLDRDVDPGDKYDYYVTAYNTDDREGMPSPLLRVTYIGESSVVVGRRR